MVGSNLGYMNSLRPKLKLKNRKVYQMTEIMTYVMTFLGHNHFQKIKKRKEEDIENLKGLLMAKCYFHSFLFYFNLKSPTSEIYLLMC